MPGAAWGILGSRTHSTCCLVSPGHPDPHPGGTTPAANAGGQQLMSVPTRRPRRPRPARPSPIPGYPSATRAGGHRPPILASGLVVPVTPCERPHPVSGIRTWTCTQHVLGSPHTPGRLAEPTRRAAAPSCTPTCSGRAGLADFAGAGAGSPPGRGHRRGRPRRGHR